MIVDVLITTFTIWALCMGPIAETCGLCATENVVRPGSVEAGIVQGTSGYPNADTLTAVLRGTPEQIDCAHVELAKAVEAAR